MTGPLNFIRKRPYYLHRFFRHKQNYSTRWFRNTACANSWTWNIQARDEAESVCLWLTAVCKYMFSYKYVYCDTFYIPSFHINMYVWYGGIGRGAVKFECMCKCGELCVNKLRGTKRCTLVIWLYILIVHATEDILQVVWYCLVATNNFVCFRQWAPQDTSVKLDFQRIFFAYIVVYMLLAGKEGSAKNSCACEC